MSLPLRLYVVRHGETAWTLTGQHTGRTDLPPTARGEQGAQALRPALAGIAFTQVLSSPMLRARSTCIGAGLGTAMRIDADLVEWDYGDNEGQRTAEIRLLHPAWDVWHDGCPGGESPLRAGIRADRLIDRLLVLAGPVALFSHGQFGSVLAARWIGLPVAGGQHFAIDPASIGVLGFEAGHPQRRVIAQWNARPKPDCVERLPLSDSGSAAPRPG